MKINGELYQQLDQDKKALIAKSYALVNEGKIGLSDFFEICKGALEEFEYENLFVESEESGTSAKQKEEIGDYSDMREESVGEEYGEEYEDERIEEDFRAKRKSALTRIIESKKVKNDNIDDVMHYTGINLKEEAENITKEIEYIQGYDNFNASSNTEMFEDLFNTTVFTKKVNACCFSKDVKITENALNLVFKTMYRKIMDLIDKLNLASELRTEVGIHAKYITATNEQSKQLWYLNEMEKNMYLRLMMKKEEDRQKRKTVNEREDLEIKKRQSNTVAMQAMGIKQKSWMRYDIYKEDEINRFESAFIPFNPSVIEKTQENRIITIEDVIKVLENDKRYNKSAFLMQLKYLHK